MSSKNMQVPTDNTRNAALNDLTAQVQNEKTRSYITTRLMPQMEWYSHEGRKCKKRYFRWTMAAISSGALIPVISVFADGSAWVKALIVALGSVVTVCNAYIAMNNFKELWLTYRSIREKLLRILYCYFNHAGAFSQSGTQEARDVLLINLCEEEMVGENSKWVSCMQMEAGAQDSSGKK